MPATPESTAGGSSALPFACYIDDDGNLWPSPGPVIAIHATTVTFPVGGGGRALVPYMSNGGFQPAAATSGQFKGGNGTNLEAEAGTPLGTLVPYGKFRATVPDTWTCEGMPDLTATFDPGDGSGELSDGTDVVATLAAGSPVPRSATWTATTYGEDTYNAGNPWTIDLDYEGAADPFPLRIAAVAWGDGCTAQAGLWNRTGWRSWESAEDPAWTITLDVTGAGEISDGTDVVAERAADAARLYDPTGQWVATAYGEATYGDDPDVTTGTPSAGTFPVLTYEQVQVEAGEENWLGQVDPTIWIHLDTATGDALLQSYDGVIAERLAGSTANINGTYTATTFGKDTYHAGAAFNVVVATVATGQPFLGRASLARGIPAAGVLYAALTVDAADEVTSVAPDLIWAASLPVNTDYDKYFPILTSDGAGGVVQNQVGPIYWKPALAGATGTGLAWVSLTAAAYAALGTPDPDTIYDITDYP
jgi:hypothetical protein